MKGRFTTGIFYFLILLLIADKIRLLSDFNLKFTDHDQCTLWNAAVETSHGRWHEPCFYGQSYNSNLEAYIAVPFLWINIPVYAAVPISTAWMGLLIFLLPAIVFYRKNNALAAISFLAIGLLWPIDFHLVMSLPRGFITGIFSVSFGFFFYEIIKGQLGKFAFGFFMALGFWLNPNCALMIAPLGLFFLFENTWKSILMLCAGALTGSGFKVFTVLFYQSHRRYLYHVKQDLEFHLSAITEQLKHLDRYFFNATWFLILLLLTTLVLFFLKRNYKALGVVVVFLIAFILTLSMDRVADGLPTIFYHWGRMYLAVFWIVPFFFVNGLSEFQFQTKKWNWILPLFFFSIAAGAFTLRQISFKREVARDTDLPDKGVVVSSVQQLYERNNAMIHACHQSNVDLIVFPENCFNCWIDAYSIPAISNGAVLTLNLSEDRRGWRLIDEAQRSSRRFLSFGCDNFHEINLQQKQDSLDDQTLIHQCMILEIDTNVIDYFRPKAKGVRFGF